MKVREIKIDLDDLKKSNFMQCLNILMLASKKDLKTIKNVLIFEVNKLPIYDRENHDNLLVVVNCLLEIKKNDS
jgi:hypothetical protein